MPQQKKANQESKVKLIANKNYEEFCLAVAGQIIRQIRENPDSRLALPAGYSPRGYYSLLAQASQKAQIDWRQVKCFALDDYLGTDKAHSFQTFLEDHLYQFTNLPDDAKFNPLFCDNYDQLIADYGGIDLCVLGLGPNGHVAFNEPPTCEKSWTHCVFLAEETRAANRSVFMQLVNSAAKKGNESPVTERPINQQSTQTSQQLLPTQYQSGLSKQPLAVPERAITVGIATIFASKSIILAVSGENKRDILSKALHDPPDAMLPASYLTAHKNLIVITDFPFSI